MSLHTNELILKAAQGEITQKIPVWLMRQAGRVLPEYRSIRSRTKDFIQFVKTPELTAEATIQPVDILNVDAAIIFSDILVIPESMGLPYSMIETKGPVFPKYIQHEQDIKQLHIATADDYQYVLDAITFAKKHLNNRVPLIGFSGAPWTLFAYITEGKTSKTFSTAKKWLYTRPDLSHSLLEKLTHSIINYLKDQINYGADIVQLFDSWAGVLNRDLYQKFCMPYLKKICDAIPEVPIILFPKDGYFTLQDVNQLNCRVISLDWTIDPDMAISIIKDKTLQGNADPCLLYADDKTIEVETIKMINKFKNTPYIANLGHGLYPDIEKEKVKLFVDIIHSYTR